MGQSLQQTLRTGLKRLLKPAVALAARHSFRIQALTELLKEVLIDVSEENLRAKGIEPNVSRLSAATGLHRRDVTRLWREDQPPKETLDSISRILGQWQADRRFLGKNGRPLVLTLEGRRGTFADLVQSVSTDLNPYTVLLELERSDAVERTDAGIKLVRRTYQPRGDVEKGFALLGNDTMTLVDSVSENILDPTKIENLHVRTEYDNIPADREEDIRRWFLSRGSSLHADVRQYLSSQDRDINPRITPGDGRLRVTFVTYSYTDPFTEAEEGTIPDVPKSVGSGSEPRSSGTRSKKRRTSPGTDGTTRAATTRRKGKS